MSCPASMANATRSLTHVILDGFGKARNLAQALNHIDFLAVFDGNTRRVVPTVLKTLQALEQNTFCLKGARVTNDSAHIGTPNEEE